jgi:hypothetical protein
LNFLSVSNTSQKQIFPVNRGQYRVRLRAGRD